MAKASVAKDRKMQARMTAISTQKVWLLSIAASQLCCFCAIVWSRVIAIVDLRSFVLR